MLNNLLIYRLTIINSCILAVIVWAATHGYVQEIYTGDTTYITSVITGLFALSMWMLFKRVGKVSTALNDLKGGRLPKDTGRKFLAKGEFLEDASQWMVTLGLIGTVIGMIIALSGIDINALGTAEGVQKSIGQLMGGMKVAVYTTFAGGFFGLWLDINRRALKTATALMIEDSEEARRDDVIWQAMEIRDALEDKS